MQNTDIIAILVFHVSSDFPHYFVHPIQQELQKQGLNLEYIDADSHSDDFYIDFIIQSLQNKKQLFVYIQINAEQKKLPNNCLKILSQLQKIKEKVHILYSEPNTMLNAYIRNLPACTQTELSLQVAYIKQHIQS